jgi:hypothetical protein
MSTSTGVVFPETDGSRSTSALGRAVASAALAEVDPVGARAAAQETNWRRGYLAHFRRLVEAGLLSPQAARTIADHGLRALHDRMRVVLPDQEEVGLREVFQTVPDQTPLETTTVDGSGTPERELSVPYRGARLRGDALRRTLDTWVREGVVERSCAAAVERVIDNPDWLDLSDQCVAVLGAGAEMGPLRSILRWGGDVAAIDLPRAEIWRRLLATVEQSAGRLLIPVAPTGSPDDLASTAGGDLIHGLPQVAQWLSGLDGPLVLGNYVYADGATNVRVSTAVDALTEHVIASRSDVALAFLATPTDVFAVPADAVAQATRAYEHPNLARFARRPVRVLSAGRLLRRNYAPEADPGINDSLVPQQGPNYALAKRLQRWRATVARHAGTTVSYNVAPPTRTRSVLRNRALAAAYAGAHRFGVEVFDPSTSNTLMAALLVHDLRTGAPAHTHPWQDETYAAAHGGLWRMAYEPRSALGLAVVLGLGSARS